MTKFTSAVIVIKSDKEDTNVVNELKRALDATINYKNNVKIQPRAQHRIYYESNVTQDDNVKITMVVDGTSTVETQDMFGGGSLHYSLKSIFDYCVVCNKDIKALQIPATKPTILLHVINKPEIATSFNKEIQDCLNVLVTLKDLPQQSLVKQVIVTKTYQTSQTENTVKIVADGKVLYHGKQINDKFYLTEHGQCSVCYDLAFEWDFWNTVAPNCCFI